MDRAFFFPLLGVSFFLASWGMVILARHLAEKNRILAREILHKERMNAMQNDVSLPQPADLPSLSPPTSPETPPGHVLAWFRIVALFFGFLLLFSGTGMVVGCSAAGDQELRDLSTLGFVPALAGVGLLIFYRLSRGLEREFTDR